MKPYYPAGCSAQILSGRTEGDPRPEVRLSIVIVNWNTRDLLQQCLASVLRETEQIKCEVFLVDNASKDGSAQMVTEVFPEVELTVNEENLGFAKAANQALRITQGRFVMLLNPDTQIMHGSLQRMIDFLEDCPEASIIGCQILNPDGTIQPSFGRFPDLRSQFLYQSYLFKLIPAGLPVGSTPHRWQTKEYTTTHEVDWATGACLMFRHELLSKVGLLDESIFMYAEDADWCFRAAREGYKAYYAPEGQIVHHFGGGAKQNYAAWILNSTKGLWHFFRKHRSQPARWCFAGLVLMGSSLRWVLWTILGSMSRARHLEAQQRREGHRQVIAWIIGQLSGHKQG